jgi:DNA-binding NarL/FixJ family response regulator
MRCKRVVIADRHPAMLEGLRRMLETETESVLMVSDEASLLQAVEAANPELVIVDLSLPASGAGNVVRLLKQWNPATPVIAVSVHDDPAAAGFVLKRRAVVDLIPSVRNVCEGRTYCSV